MWSCIGILRLALSSLTRSYGLIGLDKTCHVLDADGVSTHGFELLCVLCEVCVVENGSRRVGDSRLNVTALLLCSLDCGLEVSRVVECIEYSDDVYTVCYGLLNEVLYNVVRIVAVAEDVLTL